MKRIVTLSFVFALGISLIAQHADPLPHVLAPQEIPLIPAYRASRAENDRGGVSPPNFPVRTMAEWEEIQIGRAHV